jgi:Cu(I)/Ag(I) efflux system membrane fusion protein
MNGRTRRAVAHAAGAAVPLAAAILFATAAGCGRKGPQGDEAPAREARASLQDVGAFRIGVRNSPEPPSVGDNKLLITVRDAAGAPVRGADVEVIVAMQAMGAMPRMESRGALKEPEPGTYEAKYGLSMAGEWDVDVVIRSRDGAAAQAAYRLSTSLKEIAFVGGTPPAGGARPGAAAAEAPGAVLIDAARRQAIGVRTGPVDVRDLTATIRAAGRVGYDETRRAEVSLKFSGWVREIHVDYTGKPVSAGDVLFTAYSPELVSAQQEYLTALGEGGLADSAAVPESAELAQAARQRLLRWDIPASQIDAIARSGKPIEALPIVAPVSGVVLEKSVVRGSAFTAGQTLYKIAPTHPVWVMANVYPYELPLVRTGMAATILTPFLPERSRRGRVAYVNPYLDPDTRTAQVRIEVPNLRGDLRPDMFLDVAMESSLGKRLAVPESAVLYVGDRRIVFVDLGDGRLVPRDVTLGAKAGDYYEVARGLAKGDIVVTSGNFLVAAESRLKSAAQKW